VAQGDPLSTYLFCAAVDPIIYEISETLQTDLAAYIDDFSGRQPANFTKSEIVDICEKIFAKYGLKVNKAKCHSTRDKENNGVIDFLGVSIVPKESPEIAIATKLLQTASKLEDEVKAMV
jgi:hypothetical protein